MAKTLSLKEIERRFANLKKRLQMEDAPAVENYAVVVKWDSFCEGVS